MTRIDPISKQSGESGVTAESTNNDQGQQCRPVSLGDCSRGWVSSSSDVVLLKNEDIFPTKVASAFDAKSDDSPEVLVLPTKKASRDGAYLCASGTSSSEKENGPSKPASLP